MNRDPITKKSDHNKKRRPSLLGRCFLWLFLTSLVFFGFGFLARIPSFQVAPGEFENIVVTDTETISNSIKDYLNERFLFPKSNRLWFSKKKMETHIMNQFPRIGSVEVSISSRHMNVWGDEREGFFLWCGREPAPVRLDTPCYFADRAGFIFDTAPYFSGASYVRLYGGEVKESIIGSQAFPKDIFIMLEQFQKVLEPFELGIQAVYIQEPEQIEFLLLSNNEMPRAARLRHYTQNDISVVVENLHYALSQEEVLFDITNSYDRLEYLDTRFNNQIVYKFFDEIKQEAPSLEQNNEEILGESHTDISESEEAVETSTEG